MNARRETSPRFRRVLLLILAAVAVTVLLLAAWCTFLAALVDGLPVEEQTLGRLEPGMSKDEVVSLLGHPTGVYYNGCDWVYTKRFSMAALHIYFDDGGKVKSHYVDNF